jgi:hypothetical protein
MYRADDQCRKEGAGIEEDDGYCCQGQVDDPRNDSRAGSIQARCSAQDMGEGQRVSHLNNEEMICTDRIATLV